MHAVIVPRCSCLTMYYVVIVKRINSFIDSFIHCCCCRCCCQGRSRGGGIPIPHNRRVSAFFTEKWLCLDVGPALFSKEVTLLSYQQKCCVGLKYAKSMEILRATTKTRSSTYVVNNLKKQCTLAPSVPQHF